MGRLTIIYSSIDGDIHSPRLDSLSQEEQQELKGLFHYLFAENELGYTLLGDKPVSFCFLPTGLPHIATRDHVFKIYQRGKRSFRKGVAVWKKLKIRNFYENYFLIIDEENQIPVFALLINKRSFIEEFNKNIDVFKENYGPDITAESFFKDLIKIPFSEFFHQHLLLGILLGYGRHNAALFQRREELFSPSFRIPFLLDQKPSAGFSSIEEEIKYLNEHLRPSTRKNPYLLLVNCVRFAVDPTCPDTQILKNEYAFTHKKLTMIFKNDNWLDVLLTQMEEGYYTHSDSRIGF
ncbi:MAG: hypothetical protein K1000chlam3_00818 [Chlamydiae bacterium]|nr:hypothetical protein [Chlamydiota bacterium]